MNKRHILLLIILLVLPCVLMAQTEHHQTTISTSSAKPDEMSLQPLSATAVLLPEALDSVAVDVAEPLSEEEQELRRWYDWRYGRRGWHSGNMAWKHMGLHEGLNVSLGASVFTQLGRNRQSGVGFAQDISALYVAPLSDRLAFIGGVYLDNVDYMHTNYRGMGIHGELTYRFDEHWEASVYGRKTIGDRMRFYGSMPMFGYGSPFMRGWGYSINDMFDLGDRIGAMVRYNFSPSFSVEIGVETSTAR